MMKIKKNMNQSARKGGALVLVTVATGVASILGLSLLAASSLQTRSSGNATTAAEANYLAESGVNIAMYYIQHPEAYTGPQPDGHYPGEASVNLGADAGGTVSTEVTYNPPRRTYSVRAVAQLDNSRGSTVRTTDVLLRTVPSGNLTVKPIVDAIVLNGDATLDSGMTVTGSPGGVRTLGKVRIGSGGRVIGNVVSDDVESSGTGEVTGEQKFHKDAADETATGPAPSPTLIDTATGLLYQTSTTSRPVPTDPDTLVVEPANLPDLRTYRYKNPMTGLTLTFNATKLAATSYTSTTLGATLMNPAGVYWTDQDISFDKVTVNGTLVLTNAAKLTIKAGRSNFNAAANYPAIVSDGAIALEDTADARVSGLTYARKFTAPPGTTGMVAITGALLLSDKAAPLPTDNYEGTFSVAYSKSKAQIAGFGMSVADTDIRALRVVSWDGP